MAELDEASKGWLWQRWVMCKFGLDIFFCGSSFGFGICYWFDLILGWIFCVGSWWWSWGLSCWWWKGVGFFFIMGHMWVHGGDGGRVAMVMVVAWPWVSVWVCSSSWWW